MNTEELTQVVTAHQSAIVRNETRLDRIEGILERVAEQQMVNQQALAQLTAEQKLSRQDINSLTASILDLRNLVADFVKSREQAN